MFPKVFYIGENIVARANFDKECRNSVKIGRMAREKLLKRKLAVSLGFLCKINNRIKAELNLL